MTKRGFHHALRPALSKRWVIALIMHALLIFPLMAQKGPVPPDTRVLILHADNVFLPANHIMDSIIARELMAAGIKSGNIYAEYLEDGRFSDPPLKASLRALLATRYRVHPIDLAIITDDPTLDAFIEHGNEILPADIPLVLCGISTEKDIPPDLRSRSAVVYKKADIRRNIELIAQVLPKTREVLVFAGSGPNDRVYRSCAQKTIDSGAIPFDMRFFEGDSLDEILEEAQALPPNTAILALSFYEDRSGARFNPRDALFELTKVSPVPVFGITESYLDSGLTGGYLMSFSDQAMRAAQISLKILSGELTAPYPEELRPGYYGFSWEALVQHDIARRRLPPNATILGPPPSLWQAYRRETFFILGIFLFMGILCLVFLEFSRRKNRAEHEAQNLANERASLLRELHHRTKNNMQVISSLLNLYGNREEEGPVRFAFMAMKGRINAMSLVHDQLYNSDELTYIRAKPYLEQLVASIQQNIEQDRTELLFVLDIADAHITLETAVPLGILINELVINSVSHGFSNREKGHIGISLEQIDHENYTLGYHDDGVGLPAGFDLERDGKLGFQTLAILVDGQLKGTMQLDPPPGFHCIVHFCDETDTAEEAHQP